MVVLAASVCTRGGKAVLSRQFRDMPKSRVEALLASFPRLTSTGTQHTTVETENVRYVYQPLEELYMVLITNRQSNILQDISTLHLFAQIVTSTCRSCNETEILKNAFELLSAFDEVCSLGYRENLTLPQIKNFLEMDSHEEKIQEIIEKNKELEANEERKRRAKQLESQRKELQRRGVGGSQPGFGSGGYSSVSTKPSYADAPSGPKPAVFESKLTKAASAPKGKGMSLGKKSKQSDLFEAVRGETEDLPLMSTPTTTFAAAEEESDVQEAIDTKSIHVKITETLSAKANRDGGIESMDLKGDLTLLISDRDQGKIKVLCDLDSSIAGVQMKTHPNVDKTSWANNSAIALRDSSKSFPIDTSIGVVRWSSKSSEFELPVTVTCWPNVGNGTCEVTVEVEYTGQTDLDDVTISIPLLNDQDPQIGDSTIEGSSVRVNQNTSNLEWSIQSLSTDLSNGSLEFSCAADDADEFFPITVNYRQQRTMCGLDVADVVAASDSAGGLTFSKEVNVSGSIQII